METGTSLSLVESEEKHFQRPTGRPGHPRAHCEFTAPAQQCGQRVQTSPQSWHTALLHPSHACQTACPSPFEIPSPQMSWGRTGKVPREAHAGFILAPCVAQHLTDAIHTALALICCHPSQRCLLCPSVLWILGAFHVILVPFFYISKITNTFPVLSNNWLFYRYFTNINCFCITWTCHPCITQMLNALQLSIARSKAETTASVFLKVFITVEHRVKQSHHFYCNYTAYFECSCKKFNKEKC